MSCVGYYTGTCRTILVSPEQPVLCTLVRSTNNNINSLAALVQQVQGLNCLVHCLVTLQTSS